MRTMEVASPVFQLVMSPLKLAVPANMLLKFDKSVLMSQNMDALLSILTFLPVAFAVILELPAIVNGEARAKAARSKKKQNAKQGVMKKVDVEYCLPGGEEEDLPALKGEEEDLRTIARHIPQSVESLCERGELGRGSA